MIRLNRKLRIAAVSGALGLSIVLLAYFVVGSGVAVADLLTALARLAPHAVVLAAIAALSELTLRSLRFGLMLGHFGHPVPLRGAVVAQLIGIFAGNLSPMRIAEPAKALALKSLFGTPVGPAVVSTLLERLLDLMTIALVILVATFVLNTGTLPLGWQGPTVFAIVLGAMVGSLMWLMRDRRIVRLFNRISARHPWFSRVAESFATLSDARSHDLRSVGLWVLLSVVVLITDTSILYLLFEGGGVHVPFITVAAVIGLGTLGGVASQTPGGMGATEGLFVYLFAYAGVPPAMSLAVTVVSRFLSFYIFTIAGWIPANRVGLRQVGL